MYSVLFILFNFSTVFSFTVLQNVNFIKNNKIYPQLSNLLNTDDNKVIILNGEKTLLKRDLCHYLCKINNFSFEENDFNSFILNTPYLKEEQTMIFVNDFMIGNGRILNHFEEQRLLSIPKTTNVIILQSDNIEQIPFKNNEFIRNFKILEFPKINKKDIIRYIYDMIELHQYNDNMYILNWNKYDVEQIDFESLNILLFQINDMITKEMDMNKIHFNMNKIIKILKKI